jgi:hypothetical protein
VLKRAVRSRLTDSYDDRDGPRNEVSVRACAPASSIWINGACFGVAALIEGLFTARFAVFFIVWLVRLDLVRRAFLTLRSNRYTTLLN